MTNESARSALLLHIMDLNAQLRLIGDALGEMGEGQMFGERTQRTMARIPVTQDLLADIAVIISDEDLLPEPGLDAVRELLDVRRMVSPITDADACSWVLELL